MASKLAYQIAEDVIKELFTNGAGEKASHIVLELEDGRNGGGWAERPARVHVAEVIEKHLASIGAVEHSVQSDGLKREPTIITDFPMKNAYPAGHKPKRRR